MEDLHLTNNDFKGKSILNTSVEKVDPNKLFSENSKHSRNVLRRYIINNNLLPYKCAICGITKWNDKTISLELDHINGKNNDNRLENLRFLCPNCHSQTSTYGCRNKLVNESKYDINFETKMLVEDAYNKLKNIKKVSKQLGIRRCVVTKIVNESGQKKSNQKYVIRYDKDHNEIKRYGSLSETARDLINNNEVKTKKIKTCTRILNKNKDVFWCNSYWKIEDGCGIIHNPQLESSLIDSEVKHDEAQAKAA